MQNLPEEIAEVRLLRPEAGDIVVFQTAEKLPADALDRVVRQLREVLPKDVSVVMLDAGDDVSVIRRADIKD